MITKKLMHDIITFCNNYIDNKNVLFTIDKFPNRINISIEIWTLDNGLHLIDMLHSFKKFIYNEKDFTEYKQEILEELPKLLEQLKEK